MRRPKFKPQEQLSFITAADALEARLPGAKPKKKRKCNGKAKVKRVMADVARMRRDAAWDDACPIHFVALYSWLHEEIYGVEPTDLYKDDAVMGAMSACAKLLRDEFDANCKTMVQFVAWCWVRERKKKNPGDFRITWRYQFASRSLLTDYRVAMARRVR